MRLPFLDRDSERRRLVRALAGSHGAFCCLYGRRRCGKSRLLRQVLPKQGSVYYVGDRREAGLQRAALAEAIGLVIPGFDAVAYPDWDALLKRWWNDAPRGSVLALDEFPYLVEGSPELPSLLQKAIDTHAERPVHLILSGSSQRMMQGLVLDESEPLYGRAREIIHVQPLGAAWLPKAFRTTDWDKIVEAYATWGGVPRYWELASDFGSLWEAVESLVLEPLGVLHREPGRLLADDMRDTLQASSILAVVGQGCHRLSEIAGRLGKPATSLTRPVQRLLQLGLLRRDVPFGQNPKSSKSTLYAIEDPFLAFWFRFVDPNR
ncbi:MAG: AAA family ATPase, partial [Planctomycetota bacterium]